MDLRHLAYAGMTEQEVFRRLPDTGKSVFAEAHASLTIARVDPRRSGFLQG